MKRSTILILSVVLIATVMSGCVQEASEIGTPPAATPDAAPPAPTSEVVPPSTPAPPMIANWNYVSYRNLSISNAPTLNQTARITYSIIPDSDIEILSVGIHIPEGFVFVDAGDASLSTYTEGNFVRHSAFWTPTNLSKDEMYRFSVTIKVIKTGNWTIVAFGGSEKIYISVSEDSAYISDEPFPYIPRFRSRSQFEKDLARQNITPSIPSDYNVTRHTHPRDSIDSTRIRPPQDFYLSNFYWNGTAWVEGREPVMSNQS